MDFENKEDAIHFVKVAPRPIKERNFVMRISNKR
jgi:hypothetical protein